MSTIAFIGLGMMGFPMAHRLVEAGHTLVVKDANPAVEARFLAAHPLATRAGDDTDWAACDAVLTMLPNSDIVDAVLQALAPQLPQGACVIDMSSADPNRTRALAAALSARGIDLIDAPVSGGVKKAIDGSLAIMVGGDEAVFARQRAVLDALGAAIVHVGPVGAGHALKALNNYVSAAALIATAEAIQAGAAFGIAASTIVDVINASTGKNNTTQNKAHQFMLNGAFNSGFSLALQAKDVAIAAALGPSLGLEMALAQRVSGLTREASDTLGPTADHTELYRYAGKPLA